MRHGSVILQEGGLDPDAFGGKGNVSDCLSDGREERRVCGEQRDWKCPVSVRRAPGREILVLFSKMSSKVEIM